MAVVSSIQGAPLVDAIASLEKRVAILEPGRLEALRRKAYLAKVELDGLAKLRTSGTGTGTGMASSVRGGASLRKVCLIGYACV